MDYTNEITLVGTVHSKPEFDHSVRNHNFMKFYISINRLSEESDIIPVMVSDMNNGYNIIREGERIFIVGVMRSFNEHAEDGNHLKVYVLANIVDYATTSDDINSVKMCAYLCKEAVYRETPLGTKITDLLLACNAPDNKRSFYIPSICWNSNAKKASFLNVGDKVFVTGRFQSRIYFKTLDREKGLKEERTAYELSIQKLFEEFDDLEDEF